MYQITLKLKNKHTITRYVDTWQKASLMVYYMQRLYQDEYNYILFEDLSKPKPKTKTLKNKWKGNWC